jgi:hypothetical protein
VFKWLTEWYDRDFRKRRSCTNKKCLNCYDNICCLIKINVEECGFRNAPEHVRTPSIT